MRFSLPFLLAALLLGPLGCTSSPPDSAPSGAAVLDSARAAHGSALLTQAQIQFQFRDDRYSLRQNDGRFRYRRAYVDSLGQAVTEVFASDTTYRRVEGSRVPLSAEEQSDVETTVNSVAYFALLPEPLGDSAVQPAYQGQDTIRGVPYHRVQVTFEQAGGGRDWQDVFLYWFRTDTYAMDYLAYAYGLGPDEETGTRFRSAYNERRVSGVRFADYRNYTDSTLTVDQMHRYPALLERDALRLVSRIELDSVRVRPLSDPS